MMRAPRLLRPLFFLGAVVVAIAVFLWLANPAWRTSPLGILVLALAVLLGLAAIVKDSLDFFREIKETEERNKEP